MRVEINLLIFFGDKRRKKVDGYLSVSEGADDQEVMDAMGEFIEGATEEYMETFTSGERKWWWAMMSCTMSHFRTRI